MSASYEGWRTEAAIRELLVAQQLDPNTGHDQLGILYMHVGLEDLGDRESRRALDIDPTSEYIKRAVINNYVTSTGMTRRWLLTKNSSAANLMPGISWARAIWTMPKR